MGFIKQLYRDRWFGFIQTEEGQGLYFRYLDFQGEAYDLLTEGQQVEYDVVSSPKGPSAVNVRLADCLPSSMIAAQV